MAHCRTTAVSILIVLIGLLSFELSSAEEEPLDSIPADSSAAADTSRPAEDNGFIGPVNQDQSETDSTAVEDIIKLPDPKPVQPHYKSYISSRSYGDYLRHLPGILSLQHGAVGHPEMVTKSVMLPGLNVVYQGIPVFHQGTYMPFRSGSDLTVMMFENVSSFNLTPLSYIELFAQGEVLSLNSMIWPPENNPSSVTLARRPFGYERVGWRFGRRFTETIGATFTAGFRESDGFYTTGADYDDYRISGSAVWRARPNSEIQYSFYQYKAKQGVLQFDRIVPPTLSLNHDLNLHMIKGIYKYTENILFDFDVFHQKNFKHLFDSQQNYQHRVRDFVWGGKAAIYLKSNRQNVKFQIGGRRQYFSDNNGSQGRSVTAGLVLCDSIIISQSQNVILAIRTRHNNIDDIDVAGTGRLNWLLNDKFKFGLSGGRLDSDPDIYALYFKYPIITPLELPEVESYTHQPTANLRSKRMYFAGADADISISDWLTAKPAITLERVHDDLVPGLIQSDVDWLSSQRNVDYDRLTFTMGLDYAITRFFRGSSGLTYFYYDPEEYQSGINYSPSLLAYSFGELKVERLLRDIDVSGAFQARYISSRDYEGFNTVMTSNNSYDPAIALDGSLAIRFGAFEFRLTEENIIDYLDDNTYSIWGAYFMPQGSVWWTFTWNFEN
ncbi:MAG: hypothetical protein GY839_03490 [candidate division Zixibacteria bacterium]|nr:hypothetical protein [candidate division Zixibacteria bacterium]